MPESFVREPLSAIPLVDVRDGGPLGHARERAAAARALRDDCLAFFPAPARPLLPLLDRLARRWLTRSASPYVGEISRIAALLGFPGVWFLNGSYQWSCTSCAREEGGAPWLGRTLDWPFPGLGRHVEVARMRGPKGEFLNVTWPGFVGALTASAPGRFAACINQAPLRRRTRHPWLRPCDLAVNAVLTFVRARAIPPDQLLRQVFEECATYAEARVRLETVPVARPVIYTLVGCASGERCVIERTETGARIREHDTGAANDWHQPREGWEGRIGSEELVTRRFEEAGEKSRLRQDSFAAWPGAFRRDSFGWVTPPVLNKYTRLAVEMSPGSGLLRVVGYERSADGDSVEPATQVFEIAPAAVAT